MYGSQTVNVFFQLYLNHAVRVVWDWKDPLGHAIYLAAKFPLDSLMPLLVLQLALDNTEDRIYCFCWDTALSKCMVHRQLAWICCLALCLPITHKHYLSLLSSPACGLPSCYLSLVLRLSRCLLQSFLMQRVFWGSVCVCLIFGWRCAQGGGWESLRLSTDMECVLQGMGHCSQASALSLSCLSVLLVVVYGPANSSAFTHAVQHGGESSPAGAQSSFK